MTPATHLKLMTGALGLTILGVFVFSARTCTRAGATEDLAAKVQKQQVSVTKQAIEVSNKTEMRVQVEQFETTKATQARLEKIDEKVAAKPPVSGDPFGVVLVDDHDLDDVLRVARDAQTAAARASCRVQRTSDCDRLPVPAEQR